MKKLVLHFFLLILKVLFNSGPSHININSGVIKKIFKKNLKLNLR